MSLLKGKLKISKYGFGIIITENFKKKIRVDKKDLNNNFNGDEVLFRIKKENDTTLFVEIISEPNFINREFIGIVHHTYKKDVFVYNFDVGKNNLVMCDTMTINNDIVGNIANLLCNNNFVKFKINRYKNKLFYGHIIKNYGGFYDDDALSKYIIIHKNLSYEFSEKVITKSEKCERRYINDMTEEVKNRKDLRHINTFTIDPQGARDLDDAISLIKSDDNYKLYVHIADVSYFVKKGNSIDNECLKRSFSVYLPNQVIRMLPPILSENLCSLLPDSDKYAVTTEVDIDSNGNILNWDIYKSIIKSDYKYSYEEVYNILENEINDKYISELKLLRELSEKLKRNRLKLPDKKINENFDMEIFYSDYSHAMIEEMMILNNILVAKTLSRKNIKYPARFHSSPKYESSSNLIDLVERINNISVSNLEIEQLQSIVDIDDSKKKLINLFFIQRILQKATYDSEDSGHWALNLQYYSHFTSPIRRYPDLISHRLIFGDNYNDSTLKKYLEKVNENEQEYQQIEFFMDKVKLIRHLNLHIDKNKDKIFEGIILDIRNPTINIFIPDLFWSQDFHIADITNEKMNYNEQYKNFYKDDFVIKEGTIIQLKIKKVKVAFLEIEFEVNKI